ncbi:DUF721 domain-containing protein [Agrobacterium vitis]|uniref:DUF721 domain-containing protein n=1 Tax=Agrobacterium vitis TaxID=373 RepID=A0AAE4WFG7_AGRVI|nr:DUF721 domain-containing protein [Agrobacterium vitis]MCF1499808.1 DUF721 domain-containing protein [Allorhizobium sp. Av2]MCM2440876.1 DUF721 domain-containing protein [Agrobacterium vitis]MUZ59145.1 DUF721 domain-containing protein [Agrobacterium vitis]MVA66794.1 DUF721 domain-containing protein [Agrobacterium vitis]MVA87237.1 DUF721 domain-containing protein [Agrobacterium vitis]
MAFKKRGAAQISELANGIIDPVIARRAGISTALLSSWEEIAGADFADCTRPEKIVWPRRDYAGQDSGQKSSSSPGQSGGYKAGVLTIACEGARALFLNHAQGELIARINGFFGYPAIGQIRIVQKPVSNTAKHRRGPGRLDAVQAKKLSEMTEGIESDKLKKAVERLGRAVLSQKKPK